MSALRKAAGARRVTPPAERRANALRAAKQAGLWALRALGAVSLSAALAWCAASVVRWTTHGEAFAVKHIRFEGVQHADERDLLARSGLRPGDNVFTSDLPAAARGISSHPWVASVRLERKLPATIVARVREHEAAALVDLTGLYATDAAGRLFKRATRADALDLPVVTGVRREQWLEDQPAAQEHVSLALRLLDEWRAQGLPIGRLSEVRVDRDGGLTLFEGQRDEELLEVRVGASDFKGRLQRLQQLRAALAKRNERPVRVELDLVKAGAGPWAAAQVAQ